MADYVVFTECGAFCVSGVELREGLFSGGSDRPWNERKRPPAEPQSEAAHS